MSNERDALEERLWRIIDENGPRPVPIALKAAEAA